MLFIHEYNYNSIDSFPYFTSLVLAPVNGRGFFEGAIFFYSFFKGKPVFQFFLPILAFRHLLMLLQIILAYKNYIDNPSNSMG